MGRSTSVDIKGSVRKAYCGREEMVAWPGGPSAWLEKSERTHVKEQADQIW